MINIIYLKIHNIIPSNILNLSTSMKQSKTNLIVPKYLITIIAILVLIPTTQCFKNFGMNKPHHLFHLGDRRPVSLNIGWGYFADNDPLRMKYQNTNDQLYASMAIHDGETIFQENVIDKKSNTNTQIKYQLHSSSSSPYWQAQITMQNPQANQVTWLTYMSVQNNDYRLVDHKKYTSYIYVNPQYVDDTMRNQVNIKTLSLLYPNQSITLTHNKFNIKTNQRRQEDQQISLFGVAANISETYTMVQISETFKHLVRVYNGQETIQEDDKIQDLKMEKQDKQKLKNLVGKKDPKIVEWQKNQIEFMKQNNWTSKNYVVLFSYGTLRKGQKSTIYLTNSTKKQSKFNHQLFNKKSSQLSQKYAKNIKQQDKDKASFVSHVISNLYGGMTFYFGRLYTQNSLTVHKQDYSYSFTPSRLIFPRSFLWDDGFHQSVIVHYNQQIVIDVLTNWMNKIDIFGWIGREQIRGAQISSMMPDSRFIFQDWFQMNPPTLMMSLLTLIKKSQQPQQQQLTEQLELFFINYYRKIQNWYRYFKNTQSHQSLDYSQNINITDRFFRWHCKDQCSKGNFMGSGLDDYPRRQEQAQIAKQHVDLLSWLYFFSDSLAQVGQYMEKATEKQSKQKQKLTNFSSQSKTRNKFTRRVTFYKKQSQKYINELYQHFYDKNDSLFKDVVVTNSQLFIQKFVNKIGYINLFPFFTGMLASDKYTNHTQFDKYKQNRVKSIKKCLQIMSDEKLLLSKDGLRSLSFSDPLYGTDDNYWRGAVWLPINYMVLRACKTYYWNDPELQKQIRTFYAQLRQRLITSVYSTYKDTGYLYENYYEGRGHRGFPFYGWTATIVNIITEQY